MQDFRKLKVWEKSHQLTLAIYRTTERFPTSELYGLTSQLRRSCASIPANIAEGCCRTGDIEFGRFLQIAVASASEAEYHLLLARDLGYLSHQHYELLNKDINEVKQMLISFLKKLKAKREELTA